MAIVASGVRITWQEVPAPVRAGIESILDGEIVAADSQPGGFSPGTADRVVTAEGRRAFVKAASTSQNERTPSLHRAEARVVGHLPKSPEVPALLGVYDDGEWVAVVFEDIDGHTPTVPWHTTDINAAMVALRQIAANFTPNPVPDLLPIQMSYAGLFAGWERVRDQPPGDLVPWVRDHLGALCSLAAKGLNCLAGTTLLHADIRSDNMLVRPDGTVVVVDWPWACRGAAWFDQLLLCVNVNLYGGHDPQQLVQQHLGSIHTDAVTAVLAGVCGYFTDIARQPPNPGLPTVRAFQRAQSDSTLRWLRQRYLDEQCSP